MDYIKIAVLGDQHIPFLEKKVHQVTINFLKDIIPDKLILTGDLIDLWQISKFAKDPSRKNTLQIDIDKAKEYLKELRDTFPKAEIIFLFGNHEERLRKYVWAQAGEISCLNACNLERLLELDKLHIKTYLSDNDVHKEGILLFTHGTMVSSDSAMTARRMLKRYGMSIIHGHTHRLGAYYENKMCGALGAWENGCLCDLDLAKEWRIGFPNWQTGFNLVWMRGKRFQVDQIFIHESTILYGGQEYTHEQSEHKNSKS